MRSIVKAYGIMMISGSTACTEKELTNPPAPSPEIVDTGSSPSSNPPAPIEDTGDSAEDTGDVQDTSAEHQLFLSACAGCHGEDGDSGTAPNLSVMVPLMPDDQLTNVIVNGSGPMPGNTVPEEDVPALIEYLRERFP